MAKRPASFEYNGELVRVLDGDTIDCYIDLGFYLKIKKRIRYMGIDTWESRTRDLAEKKVSNIGTWWDKKDSFLPNSVIIQFTDKNAIGNCK